MQIVALSLDANTHVSGIVHFSSPLAPGALLGRDSAANGVVDRHPSGSNKNLQSHLAVVSHGMGVLRVYGWYGAMGL